MSERRREPSIVVVEVHDWPERAVPGPAVVVWHGRSRSQADTVAARLSERHKEARFRYEVREDETR